MKGTTFGCFNLFHITTSLKNNYGADEGSSVDTRETALMSGANLLKSLVTIRVKP